jgi:alpha-L-fucosidase
VDGDDVQVVGGNLSGSVVPSRLFDNGSLELTISDEVRDADSFAWVFKIGFGGVDQSGSSNGTGSSGVVGQTTSAAGRVGAHVTLALTLATLLVLFA